MGAWGELLAYMSANPDDLDAWFFHDKYRRFARDFTKDVVSTSP